MLGRNILPDEDQPGHANEMILSYGLWVRRFNQDRNIVGRTVQINSHDCLIIGVMPREFNFPLRRAAAHTPSPYVEFWSPLRADPATSPRDLGGLGGETATGRISRAGRARHCFDQQRTQQRIPIYQPQSQPSTGLSSGSNGRKHGETPLAPDGGSDSIFVDWVCERCQFAYGPRTCPAA
jgi:hypothetical protein